MSGAGVDRVELRVARPEDREAFVALRRASRAHLEAWEPLPPAGCEAFSDDDFTRVLASADTERNKRYLVRVGASGEIAGQVSLAEIIRGPLQQCFVGYWLGAGFTGRGLMTRALRLGVGIAFGELGLHRIEANIQPHNGPSRRLARRVGFRLEGCSPRYLKIAGRWADHERWALTAEEWGAKGDR